MNTWQLSVALGDAEAQESLAALLTALGAEGFWHDADALYAYFPALDKDGQELCEALRPSMARWQVEWDLQLLEDRYWDAPAEDIPYTVLEELRFEGPALPAAVAPFVLRIDSEGAFGDGRHPTTQRLLQRMTQMRWKGRRAMDIGCGSGVLGLAALALGAAHVVAFDNDWRSVQRTTENARRQGLEARMTIGRYDAPSIPHDVCGIFIGNIMLQVLLDALPYISAQMPAGGEALFSGFLPAELPRLSAHARREGLTLLWQRSDHGWQTAHYIKFDS
jgi:ribosomal protein L11 methyltransferase